MARQRYDIGSKWMLHNQGKGVLQVGGLEHVRRCEPMPGEIAQSRRYPDGLLQVFLGSDPKPHHALIEIATYPERRALKQALDDLTLAYSVLDHLPEMLMLVLRPKGQYRRAYASRVLQNSGRMQDFFEEIGVEGRSKALLRHAQLRRVRQQQRQRQPPQ